MVFQNYALYPNKTVYKNLAFPLQMRKLPKAEIDKKVHGGGARCWTSSTCSSASRASFRAASSSASRSAGRWCAIPRVFLMDEPLSNLDAKLRVQMRSELKRFHQDLNATDHLRHPRPARGGHHGRQDGGDERRPPAAIRHARANVFDHPVNTFVAGFVGSPAMSLIPLEVVDRAATDVSLRQPGRLGARRCRRPTRARRSRSTLEQGGARRAALDASGCTRTPSPGAVPGKVYTVEPTGDITFAQVYLGTPIVIVSLDPNVAIQPDEPVWVEFDQDSMHLFDGETQMALNGRT